MTTPVRPYSTREFDEAAVSQAVSGGLPYLTPADRHEAARRLWSAGLRKDVIAERLRCNRRTVNRALRGTP